MSISEPFPEDSLFSPSIALNASTWLVTVQCHFRCCEVEEVQILAPVEGTSNKSAFIHLRIRNDHGIVEVKVRGYVSNFVGVLTEETVRSSQKENFEAAVSNALKTVEDRCRNFFTTDEPGPIGPCPF